MNSASSEYKTIRVRLQEDIACLQLHRPEANNTINEELIAECTHVLNEWEPFVKIVILEGLADTFCSGADFQNISTILDQGRLPEQNPEPLYDLWLKLAQGPFITIAKVQGKVNAGGVGFVAACDIVLAGNDAIFSLSELLFSLMPACVLPFLIRKTGYQKAHYMSLTTQTVSAVNALEMGLVDALSDNLDALVRKHLLRLKYLSKSAIMEYKHYMNALNDIVIHGRPAAIAANKSVFSNLDNLRKIDRYVKTGRFPWENANE